MLQKKKKKKEREKKKREEERRRGGVSRTKRNMSKSNMDFVFFPVDWDELATS